MKTKLTLTIDRSISHRAKSLARRQGSSLSQLVENLLANQTESPSRSSANEPFSKRWEGKMKVSDRKDTRSRMLKRKYRIDEPN